MRNVTLVVSLLVIVLSAYADDKKEVSNAMQWQYKDGSFINTTMAEKLSPDDFYKYCVKLDKDGLYDDAASAFTLLLNNTTDSRLKELAHFGEANSLYNVGDYYGAYDEFDSFLVKFRQSPKVKDAIRRQMDCGVNLAEKGYKESLLGLALWKSSKTGIEKLKSTLERYPYEDFSGKYYMWLADFYYKKDEVDSAALEYQFIADNYSTGGVASEAIFKLGICNLRRFNRADYDTKFLTDAKKNFKRLIDSFPYHSLTDKAKDIVKDINERLAEKEFVIAEFYVRKGKNTSAMFYLRSLLANYKDTTWAEKAGGLLGELEK